MSTDILVIHNYLWSHYKGVVFSELYKQCIRHDKTFKVIHLANSESKRVGMGEANPEIHKYPFDVLFSNRLLNEIGVLNRIYRLLTKILQEKPKLLNIPGYNDFALVLLMIIAKVFKITVVMSADSTQYGRKPVAYKEFIKSLVLKIPDKFLCYGKMQKEYLESLGVKPEKIYFRCQATDNEKIIQEYNSHYRKGVQDISQKKTLLYVGRIYDEEKNIFKLVEAFKSIPDKSNWQLTIVGIGIDTEKLKEKIRDTDTIQYVNGTDWIQVVKWYATSNAFILPSWHETWGLVVTEAMLCKLPILVSKQCGCSLDLVKIGENGYIFDPHDIDDIKNSIQKIVNKSDSDLKQMGQISFDIISAYTPERSAAEMFNCFTHP